MEQYYNKNYYNIETSKNIISKLIKDPYTGNLIKVELLRKNWSLIIGEKMCKYTKPEKIYNSTLYVICIHQGWINTLQFYKSKILDNIKEMFENEMIIDNVKFKYSPSL